MRPASSSFRGACCAALLVIGSGKVWADQHAPDPDLITAYDACWYALDGSGISALEAYDMVFARTEEPRAGVINHIWSGKLETDLGELEVRASIRNDTLFECQIWAPFDAVPENPITYEQARVTSDSWFSERIARPGYHDVFPDIRFFGTVRCANSRLTITASATSDFPVDPEIMPHGKTEEIAGNLRVVMFRTSPANFPFCAASGAL